MIPDDFFGSPKPWNFHKHEILRKYLRVWASKLQKASPTLVFIDACAGAGQYVSGEDGSPLIAARWNDQFLRKHNKRLLVVAIEEDESVLARLSGAMKPWTTRNPPEALILEGKFEDHIDRLVTMTRGLPTFFFVDPFGIKGIEPAALAPLLSATELRKTEILLRVDPGLFARASGWLRSKERSERERRSASSFAALLHRLNISDETLSYLAEAGEQDALLPGERAARLLEDYSRLFTARFAYVQLIPIRASYYSAPRYMMLHATTSPHGAAKINDVVSTTEDSLFVAHATSEEMASGQGSLFPHDPNARPVRATIEVAARVARDIMRERQRPHQFIEVCADLAIAFGPDLRAKHHKRAVELLRDREEVEWSGALGEKTWIRTR